MYYIQKKWTSAKKQEYGGFRYDSGFEASYAMELDLRIKAKDIKSYQRQINIPLVVNNYLVCTYRIDFVITHNDDSVEYVETKGMHTDTWRNKWKLFEALYCDLPDVKLTIVQQGSYKPPKLRRLKK